MPKANKQWFWLLLICFLVPLAFYIVTSLLPKPFFILAPMDDVTDVVFRRIVHDCAPADLYFTEFVNVDGLQSPGRQATMKKLRHDNEDYPVVAQLWGKTPENFYKTTLDVIEMGFSGVDINMGC